jgi:hypothetical protein
MVNFHQIPSKITIGSIHPSMDEQILTIRLRAQGALGSHWSPELGRSRSLANLAMFGDWKKHGKNMGKSW